MRSEIEEKLTKLLNDAELNMDSSLRDVVEKYKERESNVNEMSLEYWVKVLSDAMYELACRNPESITGKEFAKIANIAIAAYNHYSPTKIKSRLKE